MKKMTLMIMVFSILGCSASEPGSPVLPEGNTTLGISKFIQEEIGNQTTLRGLDANGNEVARLDLVHGKFTVSPSFTNEYSTPDINGRKLSVTALGQQMYWETAGFDPVLQMPAHPPGRWALSAFLSDPHAKLILDRWQIGFERKPGEVPYTSGNYRGDSPQTCDGLTTCGTAFGGTINMCHASGEVPYYAARLNRDSGNHCGSYSGPTNAEVLVSQCCPPIEGLSTDPWYAQKACNLTSNTTTTCGVVLTGACKSCPAYPVSTLEECTTTVDPTPVKRCQGVDIYQLNWSYL